MGKLFNNNYTRLVLLLIFILINQKARAQSLPMYSQYMYNMVNINPAYAGNRNVPSLSAIWREQWSGMPGSPSTKSFTFDLPSENKKVGFGVQMFEDKYVNYIKRSGVNLYYNIKIPVSETGVISMGLKGGFYNDSRMLTNVNLGLAAPSYDIAYSSNINKIIPLAGAGVYYNDDRFYAGFSAPDLIMFSQVKNYSADNALFQVNDLHYFFTTGYSFDINEEVAIKPSVLIKATSGAPVQADFNTNVWLHNIISVGMSYRTGESILAMAELQGSPQLRFGYAYDMPFKRPNTHELFLRFEYGRLFPKSKSLR